MSGVPACLEHAPFHLSKILNMKPRLSATLLSALLAAAPAVHAATSDIPAEYGKPQSLSGKVSGTSSSDQTVAYQLTGNVTLTAIKKGNAVDSFYKTGDFYFTSASTRRALTFNAHEEKGIGDPGISRVFVDSNVTFKDLSKLEMAYDSIRYTYAPGAFWNSIAAGKNFVVGNIGEVNFKSVAVVSKNADALGGLINSRNWGQTWFVDSSTVNFEEIAIVNKKDKNNNDGAGHVGGGVIASGGQLHFERNGSLFFKGNYVYVNPETTKNITDVMNAYGGAIDLWRSTGDFRSNTTILFEGNIARSNTGSSYGGAISLFDCTTDVHKTSGSALTFSDNVNVSFSGNWAYGKKGSYGGAIAASIGDTVNFLNNTGNVAFLNNRATRKGGAIYAEETAKINITGNGSVEFKGNCISEGPGNISFITSAPVATQVYGGAVYTEADFTIANNDSVIFENNFLYSSQGSEGAAIWIGNDAGNASLIIEGNREVIFRKNYHVYEPTDYKYYRLGSIYGNNTNAQNIFSAQTDGFIRFEDAVHLMGDLAVNSSYKDKGGNEVLAGGDVIFTGENANAYLTQLDKQTATTYLTESVTSTLGGDVTVHGGALKVIDGAIVNIGGELNVAGSADNVAKVQVGAGTLNVGSLTSTTAGNKDINLNAYGAMSLTGAAVVTAGQVMLDGATLDMCDTAKLTANGGALSAANAAEITMTGGTLNIGTQALSLSSGAELEMSAGTVTAGQVTLTDATLKMQGGTLTATAGDLVVTKSGSTEVMPADEGAAEKTYDISVTGGKLDIGARTLDLGAGTSMEMTGGQVIAGQVELKNAALDMAGNATLTASGQVKMDEATLTMAGGTLDASAEGMAVQAAGIKMTGGTLNNGEHALALGSGTSMELSGSAAVTAGQVTLTDATLTMQGGKLAATGGNLEVRKSSPEVALADEGAAEKTYDVSISGGTLDIAGQTLDLGSGTSMELSGGQVKAGQVKLENAALDMAGDAVLTASGQVELAGSTLTMEGGTLNASAQGLAVQAADIKMTGGTLNNGEHALALGSGTSMELSGTATVNAGQVTLTDATLKMQGGTLTATAGDLVVTKSDSPEVAQAGEGAAEKEYDIAMAGGKLDIGTKTLALGAGTSMEMTGGQVNAGQVTLDGAKLTIAGEAQVDAQGGVTVQRTEDRQAELVMKGGTLNAGTLKLQDATLQMEGGVVDASGGVTLYDAASLVMKGGELKAGESIELGDGMKLSLSESAVVSAGRITLGASATLAINASPAGAEDIPAVQTLSVVDNMDPTVQGAMASATLSGDLVLMGGSTFDATGGFISLDGHALTLSTSDESKINLVLTLDQLADPDAKVIIFSDVTVVNFLFNLEGEAALASADDIVSVSASDYFNSEWTEEYYINFDKSARLVYLSSGLPTGPSDPVTPPDTPPVPEPTTSTLSLVALAGLALRRRRRH